MKTKSLTNTEYIRTRTGPAGTLQVPSQTRSVRNGQRPFQVSVDSVLLILKITQELNQQFSNYNLYGLSPFLNSLVARHQNYYSFVALSSSHQRQTQNIRFAHMSEMFAADGTREAGKTVPASSRGEAENSVSFFNYLQKRLQEPGFNLCERNNVSLVQSTASSNLDAAYLSSDIREADNEREATGQQLQHNTEIPFKLSRNYSFEEEGFED